MHVEQEIRLLEHGAELAGARKLDALPRPLQGLQRPHAVEVLIDEARCAGVFRVEALIGGDVGKGERQHAPPRPDTLAEQEVERDGAANLVAVRDRIDERMRARNAAVEAVDIVDARIARLVGGDVGGFEFDGEARHGAFLGLAGGRHLTRISHRGHGLRRCPGVRSARSGPKSVAVPTLEARDAAGGRLDATRRAALSGRQAASSRLPDAPHRAARLSHPAGPTAPRRP